MFQISELTNLVHEFPNCFEIVHAPNSGDLLEGLDDDFNFGWARGITIFRLVPQTVLALEGFLLIL